MEMVIVMRTLSGAMRCLILLTAALSGGQQALADLIVVPGHLANVEGGEQNVFPFGTPASVVPSQRYQQVYAAEEFAQLGGPVYITQLAFRPDAQFGRAFADTLADVQIRFSTTQAAPDLLSPMFAANVGADEAIVYHAPLNLASSFRGLPFGPMEFDIVIDLEFPFRYEPQAGNLLLDVRSYGGTEDFVAFDGTYILGDAVSRVYSNPQGPDRVDALVGLADTFGLVTRFTTIVAVPEPSSWAILGLGGFVLIGYAWRRRPARRG
jgi:hypothetical protein